MYIICGSMYIICVSMYVICVCMYIIRDSIYIIYVVIGYAKFDRMYSRLVTQLLVE